jgi:hypothetical protein
MATVSEIFVQIDNDRIELTGLAKEEFLADRKKDADRLLAEEAQRQANATAKAALLERLGITAKEAVLLLS